MSDAEAEGTKGGDTAKHKQQDCITFLNEQQCNLDNPFRGAQFQRRRTWPGVSSAEGIQIKVKESPSEVKESPSEVKESSPDLFGVFLNSVIGWSPPIWFKITQLNSKPDLKIVCMSFSSFSSLLWISLML